MKTIIIIIIAITAGFIARGIYHNSNKGENDDD